MSAAALASGVVQPTGARAEDYPVRPITIIVPAAAGSPSDFPARLASQILPPLLGQPIVIEYRPGAAGVAADQAQPVAGVVDSHRPVGADPRGPPVHRP